MAKPRILRKEVKMLSRIGLVVRGGVGNVADELAYPRPYLDWEMFQASHGGKQNALNRNCRRRLDVMQLRLGMYLVEVG